MLLPICEECYKKIIATKDRNIVPFPDQGPGMPIKEYHKLFQVYVLGAGYHDMDTKRKNTLFVYGLSDENKEELQQLPFLDNRLKNEDFIENTVLYLSEVEHFKSVIFGRKDSKPADIELRDV